MFSVFNPEGYPDVTVAKMPKKFTGRIDFAPCEEPRQTLANFYKAQEVKPNILTNGGFFNMSNGETVFDYMNEGILLVDDPNTVVGMGIRQDNQLVWGTLADGNWRDFIAAYPPLIKDGIIVNSSLGAELNYRARRTVLGYNDDNYFLACVEGSGLTFSQLRFMCLAVGMTHAINLDGGGSTKMLVDGKNQTSILYNRAVDNVVAFYDTNTCPPVKPSEPGTPVFYRVQVGAFRIRANAENMRAEITSLPDTIGAGYENAYIRTINGLFKVQVGAFSVRDNAVKVVNDLNAKGFDAYITT